jgi:hypothetical protein
MYRFKTRFMELGYTEEDIDLAIDITSEGIYTGTSHVTTASAYFRTIKLIGVFTDDLPRSLE